MIKYIQTATFPKVGDYVTIGSDDKCTDAQNDFIDSNSNKEFKVLEVGTYSSKLEGVPFKVRHSNVYKLEEENINADT